MRAKHLFEGHIYMIRNHAVARNPIFSNDSYCKRFLDKIDKYLSPVCEILHYALDQNQFSILVKLRDRESFCSFFKEKKQNADYPEEEIPFTSYIFSQAMANLQASTAIHFNRNENRTGALFARRFYKHLVETEEELEQWKVRFEKSKMYFNYAKKWMPGEWKRSGMKEKRKSWFKNAAFFYTYNKSEHPVITAFQKINLLNLQGQFINLPLKQISLSKINKNLNLNPSIPP